MSQDELAAASGAKKPMISKLESGARELTRSWAERFAGPLRVSAIRIVFWDKVGEMEPGQAEAEFAIPNAPGWSAPEPVRDMSGAKSAKVTAPRQKPLKTSVVKLYVYEWRRFMGAKIEVAAKALGVTAEEYEDLEQYPFRLTADEMARVAKAIGVDPNQFFFPVTAAQLTEAQKKLPAGLRLLKRTA